MLAEELLELEVYIELELDTSDTDVVLAELALDAVLPLDSELELLEDVTSDKLVLDKLVADRLELDRLESLDVLFPTEDAELAELSLDVLLPLVEDELVTFPSEEELMLEAELSLDVDLPTVEAED